MIQVIQNIRGLLTVKAPMETSLYAENNMILLTCYLVSADGGNSLGKNTQYWYVK